jgi:hypothetical protein
MADGKELHCALNCALNLEIHTVVQTIFVMKRKVAKHQLRMTYKVAVHQHLRIVLSFYLFVYFLCWYCHCFTVHDLANILDILYGLPNPVV